jgi:hypothetical protein
MHDPAHLRKIVAGRSRPEGEDGTCSRFDIRPWPRACCHPKKHFATMSNGAALTAGAEVSGAGDAALGANDGFRMPSTPAARRQEVQHIHIHVIAAGIAGPG